MVKKCLRLSMCRRKMDWILKKSVKDLPSCFVSALENGLMYLSFRWGVISCSIAYRNICFQLKSAKMKLKTLFLLCQYHGKCSWIKRTVTLKFLSSRGISNPGQNSVALRGNGWKNHNKNPNILYFNATSFLSRLCAVW